MLAGQITGCVNHIAVPIAMIQEDIRAGNSIPKKIKGTLNPSDMGTKPNPATTLHRHFRLARGHRFYPAPTSEHGKLMQMQVELVNQRLTEFVSAPSNTKFNYQEMSNITAVYNNKEQSTKKNSWRQPSAAPMHIFHYLQSYTKRDLPYQSSTTDPICTEIPLPPYPLIFTDSLYRLATSRRSDWQYLM